MAGTRKIVAILVEDILRILPRIGGNVRYLIVCDSETRKCSSACRRQHLYSD